MSLSDDLDSLERAARNLAKLRDDLWQAGAAALSLELDRLRAVNAELLAACKALLDVEFLVIGHDEEMADPGAAPHGPENCAVCRARDAVARAEAKP